MSHEQRPFRVVTLRSNKQRSHPPFYEGITERLGLAPSAPPSPIRPSLANLSALLQHQIVRRGFSAAVEDKHPFQPQDPKKALLDAIRKQRQKIAANTKTVKNMVLFDPHRQQQLDRINRQLAACTIRNQSNPFQIRDIGMKTKKTLNEDFERFIERQRQVAEKRWRQEKEDELLLMHSPKAISRVDFKTLDLQQCTQLSSRTHQGSLEMGRHEMQYDREGQETKEVLKQFYKGPNRRGRSPNPQISSTRHLCTEQFAWNKAESSFDINRTRVDQSQKRVLSMV